MRVVVDDEALRVAEDRRGGKFAVATATEVLHCSGDLFREGGQPDDRDREMLGEDSRIKEVGRAEPQLRARVAGHVHRFGLEASTQGHGRYSSSFFIRLYPAATTSSRYEAPSLVRFGSARRRVEIIARVSGVPRVPSRARTKSSDLRPDQQPGAG